MPKNTPQIFYTFHIYRKDAANVPKKSVSKFSLVISKNGKCIVADHAFNLFSCCISYGGVAVSGWQRVSRNHVSFSRVRMQKTNDEKWMIEKVTCGFPGIIYDYVRSLNQNIIHKQVITHYLYYCIIPDILRIRYFGWNMKVIYFAVFFCSYIMLLRRASSYYLPTLQLCSYLFLPPYYKKHEDRVAGRLLTSATEITFRVTDALSIKTARSRRLFLLFCTQTMSWCTI